MEIFLVRNRARFSISVLLFSSLGWIGTLSQAQQNLDTLRGAIETKIAERHPTDTRDWWISLGPQAPSVIRSLYEAETSLYRRTRLLEALGYYSPETLGPETKVWIQKQAEDPQGASVIRGAAIRSIATAYGSSAADWVSQFKTDSDGNLRMVSERVLLALANSGADLGNQRRELVVSSRSDSKPLRIVKSGTSEDAPLADWSGVWKGRWVEPQRVSRAVLEFGPKEPAHFVATLTLGQRQSRVLLRSLSWQRDLASGSWTEGKDSVERSFEARLSTEGRVKVLRITVPYRSGTAVLFR